MISSKVNTIIILIEDLSEQEQLIKLKNAEKNNLITADEIDYIKDYLNIKETVVDESVVDETQTMTETQTQPESTVLTEEETANKTVGQQEEVATVRQENPKQVILVDTRMIDATKKYIKSKSSYEGRLEKIAEEAKSIEILSQEDYTLEEAKKVKTQLVKLRNSVIVLQSDVQLLHDGGIEKTTERMRATTETLNIIAEKVDKLNFYILEKRPKVEEVEEEELTPWNKVKNFFGNIRKKFISTESESPRKVQKRFKRIKEKLNEIIEFESKEIERLSRDDFLWRDNVTEEKRIDIVYRTMCGKSYIAKVLEGPEDEKNEVIRLLCFEMQRRHKEWLENPRNPVNMGQIVCGREQQPNTTKSKGDGR